MSQASPLSFRSHGLQLCDDRAMSGLMEEIVMYVAAVLAGYVVSRDEHRHATKAIRSHCCAVGRSRGTDSSANLAGGEDGDDAQPLDGVTGRLGT
jgi:hypothetical protein